MLQVCKFSHLEFMDPVPCHELGRDQYGFGNLRNFVDTCVTAVLKVSGGLGTRFSDLQIMMTALFVGGSAFVQGMGVP